MSTRTRVKWGTEIVASICPAKITQAPVWTPRGSSHFAEVLIMQCLMKMLPSVNITYTYQDLLASSDCKAPAEQSPSTCSAWTPWSPSLIPPLSPFNIVWKLLFQSIAVLPCFISVKLSNRAGLKKKEKPAVSLYYLLLQIRNTLHHGVGHMRKLFKKKKSSP